MMLTTTTKDKYYYTTSILDAEGITPKYNFSDKGRDVTLYVGDNRVLSRVTRFGGVVNYYWDRDNLISLFGDKYEI